jgi:adenylylsulfate kinase-like enzyme
LEKTVNSKAFVLWFTGLSGSGKSALADRVFDYIASRVDRVEKLDRDLMRGLLPGTGAASF